MKGDPATQSFELTLDRGCRKAYCPCVPLNGRFQETLSCQGMARPLQLVETNSPSPVGPSTVPQSVDKV